MKTSGLVPAEKLPRWTVLSVTTLGAFMAALDSNIVTIALPYISKGLSAGYSLLGWVLAGYILAVASLVLQAGKMGDSYGKKNVYLAGFAIFGVSSALCGLSLDAYQLIAFRVLQGVGASVMIATGIPMIFASFPVAERGAAIGVNSVAWALGAVAGPVLGGILTQLDWRLIFFVNVPVAALAILVGSRRIPGYLNSRNPNAKRLNLVNAGLLGVTIAGVILWLTFFDPRPLPVSALALLAFVFAEKRSGDPVINRDLLRNSGFLFSVLSLAITTTSFFGILFVVSFYFQNIAGFSPLQAGLWVAPLPIALGVFNPLAGRVFDRLKRPAAVSIAGALIVLGCLLVLASLLGSGTPGVAVPITLAVAGAGAGLVWTPSISSALKFASQELRGVANGTAFTLIYIGFVTSVALVVSVSTSSLPASLAGLVRSGSLAGLTPLQSALFDGGLVNSLYALAFVGALGIPLFVLVVREQGKHFGASESPGP
ncbi:MAG: MFS transporter [Thaumarchaeota archaeon]|nr:MFS transporter [Nitrososphaerota archaeon]